MFGWRDGHIHGSTCVTIGDCHSNINLQQALTSIPIKETHAHTAISNVSSLVVNDDDTGEVVTTSDNGAHTEDQANKGKAQKTMRCSVVGCNCCDNIQYAQT